MEVKRGEDIHEDPWDFLEKELQNFQKVLKDLESGTYELCVNYIANTMR